MHPRFATSADAAGAVKVWREAAMRLIAQGEPLWAIADLTPDLAADAIGRGELVVGERNGEIVAAMILQSRDLDFWPDRDDGSALYLHKIAVADAARGKGAMQALVAWAAIHARSLGKTYLRLDCDSRPKLCAAYERLGFAPLNVVEACGFRVVRYQLSI